MIKLIRVFFLLAVFMPFQLHAWYWSPHVGADWKYWGAKPKNKQWEDFEKFWPDISNSFSFYAGSRINGFFGFDLGYEQSTTKEKSFIFNGVQSFVTPTAEPAGNLSDIELRLKAWYAHFNFYWEVATDLELIGILGLSTLKPDTHIFYTAAGVPTEIMQKTKSKTSARIGVGVQYNPWWFLGIKGSVLFDQISRLNYEGNDIRGSFFSIKPYKNATSFHLGFVLSYTPPRR